MFEEGNLVIFTCHDTTQVGMITAVNRRTGTKKTYNIRSEKGFEYICVGVDDLLSSYTILKDISKQNLKSKKIKNNMYSESTANLSAELTKIEKSLLQMQK
jgi:hypothetical protein